MTLWNFNKGPKTRKRIFGRRINFNLGFVLMAAGVVGVILLFALRGCD